MSNPARTITTRAKNATQHPGYAQRQPRQPADPNAGLTKAKKAEAARAAKAKKAAVKKLNISAFSKFEQDAMEREDLLNVTPRPNFRQKAGRVVSSGSAGAGSVIESEVDTDEIVPDKATYQPSPTPDDDSLSDLSAVPSSPVKKTYAEVASPKRKSGAAVRAKATMGTASTKSVAASAALATKSNEQVPTNRRVVQPEALIDIQIESHSPPPPSRRKPTNSQKTPQTTTASNRKGDKALKPGSATESDSATPTPTALPQTLNPKTAASSKKSKRKRVVSAHGNDTEADSPPHKPNPRSLRRLESYRDLGDLDENIRKSMAGPKKTSGSRVDGPSDKDKGSEVSDDHDPTAWRSWKARQPCVETQMDVVQGTQMNAKGKGKDRMSDQTPIAFSDNERAVPNHNGKAGRKAKAVNVKGKNVVETKAVKRVSKFAVPTLTPAGAVRDVPAQKRSHQNVNDNPNNISRKRKYDTEEVEGWVKDVSMPGRLPPSAVKRSTSSATPMSTNRTTITASSLHTQRNLQPPEIRVQPEPEDDVVMGESGVVSNRDYLFAEEDGAISDRDEIDGEEHENAVKSPPKGTGVRLSSEHWVRYRPAKTSTSSMVREGSLAAPPVKRQRSRSRSQAPSSHVPNILTVDSSAQGSAGSSDSSLKNNQLPLGTDMTLWRRNFIPSVIQFIARQNNPWAIPPLQMVPVMQTIWNEFFGNIPQTITATGVIYRLAMQRVSDSWRSPIGSTAIMVIIAFFNTHSESYGTDNDRQEWAAWYLEHHRFAYKKADGDDPLKFKGMLRGPLVIQTFGAHWTAVVGARDASLPAEKPIGGLGLAAAAVMRALTLVKDGIITVESINAAYPKCPNLPKSVNISTGKRSSTAVSFNDDGWGDVSRGFTKVATRIAKSTHQFEKIESTAKGYSKCTTRNMDTLTTSGPQDPMNNDDEWALLAENYDSDDDTD